MVRAQNRTTESYCAASSYIFNTQSSVMEIWFWVPLHRIITLHMNVKIRIILEIFLHIVFNVQATRKYWFRLLVPAAGMVASVIIFMISSSLYTGWSGSWNLLLVMFSSIRSAGRFFRNHSWFLISGIVILLTSNECKRNEILEAKRYTHDSCNKNTS